MKIFKDKVITPVRIPLLRRGAKIQRIFDGVVSTNIKRALKFQSSFIIKISQSYFIPLTLVGKVYTDFEAVMNRISLFFPPKATLDVHFSGIEI